jgi:ABC-type dipeptide/oligopeptide/nickel transport system ATPase subunit
MRIAGVARRSAKPLPGIYRKSGLRPDIWSRFPAELSGGQRQRSPSPSADPTPGADVSDEPVSRWT